MQDTFSNKFTVTLFCGGHLGFEPSQFFSNYLTTTDDADDSEVLVELYTVLFCECNNCYRVQMLVHRPA